MYFSDGCRFVFLPIILYTYLLIYLFIYLSIIYSYVGTSIYVYLCIYVSMFLYYMHALNSFSALTIYLYLCLLVYWYINFSFSIYIHIRNYYYLCSFISKAPSLPSLFRAPNPFSLPLPRACLPLALFVLINSF